MVHPTSIRLSQSVKHQLEQQAARANVRPAALAARLIDEGVRMADHPGIVFRDSAAHDRVACLARGPDVAEVIEVLIGLKSHGEERVAETAEWLGMHPTRVRLALSYYTEHQSEVDAQIRRRREEAEELRQRHEAERALLE